jgi:hypothetical protein
LLLLKVVGFRSRMLAFRVVCDEPPRREMRLRGLTFKEVCVLLRLQANLDAACSSSHALQEVYSGGWHAGVSYLTLQSTGK